jgi:hypothetical protein
MKTEIWKDIPGYEGRYQASDLGRIKSLRRQVRSKNWYTHKDFYRTVPERILRPGRYAKTGHLSVVLERGGSGKPVHKLILMTFVGRPPQGCESLHRDGNPANNRLDNLHYGTRTENILDVYRQGGRWRKLNINEVLEIRSELDSGERGVALALKYEVSQATISAIKRRRTYRWLTSEHCPVT